MNGFEFFLLQDRKAAKAKELSARLAQAEADYENTARYQEAKRIKEKLIKLGLVIKQVMTHSVELLLIIKICLVCVALAG